MKILIADDIVMIRKDIIRALTEILPDAEFLQTGNADKAVEIVRQTEGIVLVIMDEDLGPWSMRGSQAIREIRTFSEVPIVYFSSAPDSKLAEEADQLKVDMASGLFGVSRVARRFHETAK